MQINVQQDTATERHGKATLGIAKANKYDFNGCESMGENAKKNLEQISEKLNELPKDVANAALDQYAARMEGFAEGFAAGKAHAENRPAYSGRFRKENMMAEGLFYIAAMLVATAVLATVGDLVYFVIDLLTGRTDDDEFI